MKKHAHRALLAIAGMALTVGSLAPGAGAQGTPPNQTPSRTKFVLPGGEVVVGQIISYKGEMFVVRLPRGVMLLRKDFPVAMKSLGTSGRVARDVTHTKPVL